MTSTHSSKSSAFLVVMVASLLLAGCAQNGSSGSASSNSSGMPDMSKMAKSVGSWAGGFAQTALGHNATAQQALGSVGGGRAIGTYVGTRIGSMLSQKDQNAVQAQTQHALATKPDGAKVNWVSVDSGASATIEPGDTRTETRPVQIATAANSSGNSGTVMATVTCRDVKTTVTSNGETETDKQTACKAPNGTWQLD